MKQIKKGQISLEFLTTYGWALLILAIMIGALSYILMSPDEVIPPSCTFPDRIHCTEHALTEDGIIMSLANFDTAAINITKVSCIIDNEEHISNVNNEKIRIGASERIDCTGGNENTPPVSLTPGELMKATVLITYIKDGNEFPTITQGNVVGIVQE